MLAGKNHPRRAEYEDQTLGTRVTYFKIPEGYTRREKTNVGKQDRATRERER
jgi:hypothetical protein